MKPKWVPGGWELPPDIVHHLGRKVGRQRALEEDGHLLVILHGPPKPGQDDREARLFWRLPDGSWKVNHGKGIKAFADLDAEYQALIDGLEAEEDSATCAEDFFKVLEHAHPVVRSTRNMLTALQQAHELIPEDKDLVHARDDAYNVERNAELLVADVRNSLEMYVAKQHEDNTKAGQAMALAGHRLNTLAAIFFPTATLATILGMNVVHGFETFAPPIPFLIAIVAGLALGVAVKAWLDRPG